MPAPKPSADHPLKERPVTLQIFSVVIFTFLCYGSIGLPLAVVPGYVTNDLGYSSVIAGLAISSQYFSTFFTRALAGRMTDTVGAKRTVQRGLIGCLISGAFLIVAALLREAPAASLLALLVSRLTLGLAESYGSIGSIMWGIGLVGQNNNAKVISWNGVATYSALAAGAPIGVLLTQSFGFASLGGVVILLAAFGLLLTRSRRDAPVVHGERLPFFSVFSRVLPFGLGLSLGSAGFGALATFVTLYYAAHHWPNAALSLTVFGVFFVGARLLFSNAIKRHGGFCVAVVSFTVEAIGLALVWLAFTPSMALVGAGLTGLGFSLVFPALGVEAVSLVPPASRGAALSAYSVFLDLALGITGPIAGWIATGFGYSVVYLFGSGAALSAIGLCYLLAAKARKRVASGLF